MKSKATKGFWRSYTKLPEGVQLKARLAYQKWKRNPRHPGLEFKLLAGKNDRVCSARIDLDYRAVGFIEDRIVYRVWIGHHHEYDRLIERL